MAGQQVARAGYPELKFVERLTNQDFPQESVV
jgi:hypothetical protein